MARASAGEVLDELAWPVDADGATLRAVAATTMTADMDDALRRRYAVHVVTAVRALAAAGDGGAVNTGDAKVLAAPGADDGLYRGLVLDRPDDADPTGRGIRDSLFDATVAVLDAGIDFEKTASVLGGGNGVRISSPRVRHEWGNRCVSPPMCRSRPSRRRSE